MARLTWLPAVVVLTVCGGLALGGCQDPQDGVAEVRADREQVRSLTDTTTSAVVDEFGGTVAVAPYRHQARGRYTFGGSGIRHTAGYETTVTITGANEASLDELDALLAEQGLEPDQTGDTFVSRQQGRVSMAIFIDEKTPGTLTISGRSELVEVGDADLDHGDEELDLAAAG